MQKRAAQRACIRRLKARETEDISLVTRIPMASEIDHRDLTNRVTTPFTLVGHAADSRGLAEYHRP